MSKRKVVVRGNVASRLASGVLGPLWDMMLKRTLTLNKLFMLSRV